MSIQNLFNCRVFCSCGLCCSKNILCDRCEIATLEANGIPLSFLPEIKGLKYKSQNHNDSSYSELGNKLMDIEKKLKDQYN